MNAQGKLAENYAFGGSGSQKIRLEADGIVVNNNKVDLKRYQWSYEDDERLFRIIKMERYFEELLEEKFKNHGVIYRSNIFQDKMNVLCDYYQNGLWLQDYECDERGELPEGLKRGILSQDGLYNLLSDI